MSDDSEVKRVRGTGDVDLANELAHAHTRQFQDNFINFMRENYTTDVALGPLRAAE